MRQVEVYRCANCGLEVALTPPVERPCPNCGGDFVTLDFWDHREDRDLYTPVIDRIVEETFPQIFTELESYLAEQVDDG